MEVDDSLVESFSSNDIVSCLYNKNATEKCRIGLADTLVYENGAPVRWYVTGKTGEVTKKRGVDMAVVSQRWMKIREQYDSPVVAIVRQTGGVLKFLNVEAWNIFISEKADASVLSVHCFINGENHQVYRNKFTIKDTLGRSTCSTHVYTFTLPKDADSVITLYEDKLKMVESRANQIKNIMDLATNTVLRYTETMLQVRILDMTVDYVIDKKSQIWMLWAPETRFTRATDLKDVELPNIPDKRGRAGWMGDKYFEEIQDREYFDQTLAQPSPTRPGSSGIRNHSPGFDQSSRTTGAFSPQRTRRGQQTYDAPTATSLTKHAAYHTHPDPHDRDIHLHVATAQVKEASGAVAVTKTQRKRVNENESATNNYNVTQQPTDTTEAAGHFPHPFKCKGDYCNFLVTPAGNLAAHESAAEHHYAKLFSAKEIEMLRKDRNFSQMMQFESAGPALAVLTMRSIILARQERRGIDAGNTTQSWNSYPDSPRGKIKFRPDPPAIAHLDEKTVAKNKAEEVKKYYHKCSFCLLAV